MIHSSKTFNSEVRFVNPTREKHPSILWGMMILCFLLLASLPELKSQGTTKIELKQAAQLSHDITMGEMQRIIGNVIFEHDGALMYCDSAWLFDKTNSLEAFGRIKIQVNDTVTLYGDHLNYDGNTRLANLTGRVVLKDNKSRLTSEMLIYDRNANTAFYNTGGMLRNGKDTLTSRIGTYNASTKNVFFKDSVVLRNGSYVINTDTLMFETRTQVANFYSPTDFLSNKNKMYCELGWYNTQTDQSVFRKNAYITNGKQSIYGDSLYFDQKTNFGLGYKNVVISDSLKNVQFKGNFAEYRQSGGYSYVTDSALAIMVEQIDTFYLHADTLRVLFDTAQNPQRVFAYHHCTFFRTDIQGACDSLAYLVVDSLIYMYRKPMVWSGENQLQADTIIFRLKNRQIDKMYLNSSAFIIASVDTTRFNQIKGRYMVGDFVLNKLKIVDVDGNAESLYYVMDDFEKLIGINKTESSYMTLEIDSNLVSSILISGKPKASMSPEAKMTFNDLHLRNFNWQIAKRPLSWFDLFRKQD
jgi:lipopolysaccharide export system protein LptA